MSSGKYHQNISDVLPTKYQLFILSKLFVNFEITRLWHDFFYITNKMLCVIGTKYSIFRWSFFVINFTTEIKFLLLDKTYQKYRKISWIFFTFSKNRLFHTNAMVLFPFGPNFLSIYLGLFLFVLFLNF